jgi:hypothetical protein
MHGLICLTVWAALSFASAPAQSPHIAPLSAGTCVTLHPGELFSLEWNPAFDYQNEVAGLDRFTLSLSPLASDNATPVRHLGASTPNQAGFRASLINPLANGYYHFEFQVPPRFSTGLFRVTGSLAIPHPAVGASGPAPRMTSSPENEYLCINIVAPDPVVSPLPQPKP